ncbi:MAG: acyltransferase [Candidatus Thermoplasmatota archaeon]|nr:acyltransferase [Candidatus Thermoplasmatota archaeon]
MTFDRKTLVIPDETKFEEKTIFTNGDVIVSDRSLIRFGIKTNGRIFVGEHVIIDGDIDSSKDIRIDTFSHIGGNVKSGGNVFLGEKVKIDGKLSLSGDLDVADSVSVNEGFEAKGWINIRSPIPIIIYIFIYLVQLLKMGHSEEIEKLLNEIEENNGETIPISDIFLFIPNNSIIGIQKAQIDSNLHIGKKSLIIGNYNVKGNIVIDDDVILFGSIKNSHNISCGKNINIHGNIDCKGEVRIDDNTLIVGDIFGDKIYISKFATIDGMLQANKGVSFLSIIENKTEDKIRRFESNLDKIEGLEDIME